MLDMNNIEKQYICCYNYPNINYPPQFFIVSNLFETHPFLISRDRIECYTTYKNCMNALEKAKKLFYSADFFEERDSIKTLFNIIEGQGLIDIVIIKKGKKPIDTDGMRNAKSRKFFIRDIFSEKQYKI